MPTPSSIKTISTSTKQVINVSDFDSIHLSLASPETIAKKWSHGEVTKPETINYRTQKPEKDGLFCERIFGPVKDWECACGKYKKIRYKGITCDKCGVEVTRSIVRRVRMGHIELAAPVSHIWFLRGIPSRIGLILDLSIQNLEKVIYFANFIITHVDEDLKKGILEQMEKEFQSKKKALKKQYSDAKAAKVSAKAGQKEIDMLDKEKDQSLKDLKDAVSAAKKELDEIKPKKIISKAVYQEMALKYGHIFEAKIGAEAIRDLLSKMDLAKEKGFLEKELASEKTAAGNRRKIVRRLKLINNFIKNDTRPEWMIMTAIPVIPADLRPMVQLDGGRFASSDLNDLYRRVINRNNRLKRLLSLNAPEVICCNEKRMLQEAVDALIDNNARHGKTVTSATGKKRTLKSLADILKGKQGRFRQNLLGKRVDYSGRSVIVVGPKLKLYQCGLPKLMAIELFKPFVISELIKREIVHNVRSGSRLIEEKKSKEVWDILEEITNRSYVLLNRAPTLHRLSIQAFRPVLIEGKAIQIHPLVCPPFNADFDGDQMAVHVPLTKEAMKEAGERMLSSKNLLKPATGDPVIMPTQDMIWGCYYLSLIVGGKDKDPKDLKRYYSPDEVMLAYDSGKADINERIMVRIDGEMVDTGVGRVVLNEIFPEQLRRYDTVIRKGELKKIIGKSFEIFGTDETAELLDDIKEISLQYLTKFAPTWSMGDLPVIEEKGDLIKEAEEKVNKIEEQYENGLLAETEKHMMVVEHWQNVKSRITELTQEAFAEDNPIYSMISSKARGSWGQLVQMMGMKGLVASPSGDTIELPVKSNFKEGFDVLEYFISTHGARKGLSDTALKTAAAGYLTRRLVDICHDVITTEEDCGDDKGWTIDKKESEEIGETMAERLSGRVVMDNVVDPETKEVIVKAGEIVTSDHIRRLEGVDIESARIRSLLTCRTKRGICRKCYGIDLGRNRLVEIGEAVGVVAAQSIGEPGTQLTMRTFHTGGVAGKDITQGLPRVEELFEARPVKRKALVSEVDGKVKIEEETGNTKILIEHAANKEEKHNIDGSKKSDTVVKVKDGDAVKKGDVLYIKGKKKTLAKHGGTAVVKKNMVKVVFEGTDTKEYAVPRDYSLWVEDGDLVTKGDQLTEGSLDIHELYRLKDKEAVQRYLVKEALHLYLFQGQKVADKHVEIIVRQMFSRIYVQDAGDTDLLAGEVVTRTVFEEANDSLKKGKKPAVGDELLLGITKVSLSTESFLSAASFQETARVLINAVITEKKDALRGLKENVIIGRLIPVGTGFKESKKA